MVEQIPSAPTPCRPTAGGAAWNVAAIGLVTAVPAFASSASGSLTVLGRGMNAAQQTVSVPCRATVHYTLWGGGGAGNPASPDYQGGSGAKITGSFTLADCDCHGGLTPLTVIAAGGGGPSAGGAGYGNGGAPGRACQAPPAGDYGLSGTSQGSGGGGGSAILLGASPACWSPIVVAGGGGGGGGFLYYETTGDAVPLWQSSNSVHRGHGGSAPSGAGTATTITLVNGHGVRVPGAPGGADAMPGSGGAGGTTTLPSHAPATQNHVGRPGGRPTPRIGGDGAGGVCASLDFPPADGLTGLWEGVGSAGGGGGYAGGGSSGLTLASLRNPERHLVVGVSAGGGAGSNYLAAGLPCVRVGSASMSTAVNGGIGTVGGAGLVTLSWS